MASGNSLAHSKTIVWFTQFFRSRFYRWIDKRAKPATEHILSHHRLYILPTLRGYVFVGLVVLLWMLGTNYQNNLILSLAFFLISLFIVTVLHTYANLSGFKITFASSTSVFAGENADFIFTLYHPKYDIENVSFCWRDSEYLVGRVDVKKKIKTQVSVPLHAVQRGWLIPGRLLVQSEYPLGLLRCWTWLNWRIETLVYPAPISAPQPVSVAAQEEAGSEEHPIRGGEDFSHLVEYRPGDAINHIAWKQFAQGKGVYIKEFSQTISREIWLDFNTIGAGDTESRLSALCFWALQYDIADEHYGLRLPGTVVPPGKGYDHKILVLRALATYGLNSPRHSEGVGDAKR